MKRNGDEILVCPTDEEVQEGQRILAEDGPDAAAAYMAALKVEAMSRSLETV